MDEKEDQRTNPRRKKNMSDFFCWELYQVESFGPFEEPHLLIIMAVNPNIFYLGLIYLVLPFQ